MNIQIGTADTGQAKPYPRESAQPASPAPSLSTLARQALDESGQDVSTAGEVLATMLENPEVRRALAFDAVKTVAQSAIASVRSYERSAIEKGRQASKLMLQAVAVDRAFMSWPLPYGGVLGDARKDDLIRAIHAYRTSADASLKRMAWLEKISAALPEGARVRDALTEAQLAEWSAQ